LVTIWLWNLGSVLLRTTTDYQIIGKEVAYPLMRSFSMRLMTSLGIQWIMTGHPNEITIFLIILKVFECHELHLTINCLLHYDLHFSLYLFIGILNFIILYFGTILLCSCFRKMFLVCFDMRNGRLWCRMFWEWKDMLFSFKKLLAFVLK
jgi:hypothetical protein